MHDVLKRNLTSDLVEVIRHLLVLDNWIIVFHVYSRGDYDINWRVVSDSVTPASMSLLVTSWA